VWSRITRRETLCESGIKTRKGYRISGLQQQTLPAIPLLLLVPGRCGLTDFRSPRVAGATLLKPVQGQVHETAQSSWKIRYVQRSQRHQRRQARSRIHHSNAGDLREVPWPLEGCRDQFMNSGEISRGFASNDHCIDLRRSHRYRTSGVRSSLSAPSVNLSTCSTLDFQDISYLKRLSDTGFMKSAELHHEWRR